MIAENVLAVPAETILRFQRAVPLAESALAAPRAGFGGVELYLSFEMKAAVLCSRLTRVRGPQRLRRHRKPTRLFAGAVAEVDLAGWIRERLRS